MKKLVFSLKELVISDKNHTLRIEGINFTADQDKNTVALVGDSGIGKTTIFKSLFPRYIQHWKQFNPYSFIAEHSYGEDKINHSDICNNNVNIKISFANQLPFFLESHSVTDNIFSPLKWKGESMKKEEKETYIQDWSLEELSKKPVSILSGGQRQLVNLARALVIKPEIMIIDECFSSMNEEMAEKYISFIKNTHPNVRFIVTSHRASDITRFGGRKINLLRSDTRRGYSVVTMETGADD